MTQALSESAIQEALKALAGWEYARGAISKTYEFPQYLAGVAFASAVGVVCEGLDHHPDLTISYRKVRVELTTHDAGNAVTQKDVDTALAIENLGYPK
jgi:4a-hydroxytetrahydrobiopterin dehydratase